MSYKIKTIQSFEKELKSLSKKYPSLKRDYESFLDFIEVNPLSGQPIGKDCYKMRFAIQRKGKGKSGGAKVITCVKIVQSTVFLLSIYDKSEMENVTDASIKLKLKEIK
jgi:mRNA-degrading endonuclease RelE of RelBE toxin-antitoxin system